MCHPYVPGCVRTCSSTVTGHPSFCCLRSHLPPTRPLKTMQFVQCTSNFNHWRICKYSFKNICYTKKISQPNNKIVLAHFHVCICYFVFCPRHVWKYIVMKFCWMCYMCMYKYFWFFCAVVILFFSKVHQKTFLPSYRLGSKMVCCKRTKFGNTKNYTTGGTIIH